MPFHKFHVILIFVNPHCSSFLLGKKIKEPFDQLIIVFKIASRSDKCPKVIHQPTKLVCQKGHFFFKKKKKNYIQIIPLLY
jgi:hypothetical protein